MNYVNLGNTGLKVSRICLGCWTFGNDREWNLDLADAKPIFDRAVDLGVNFFDTANMYSNGRSEEILGELVKDDRESFVIATKLFNPMGDGPNDKGLSRKHIMCEINNSLNRLKMDYVDLYQIHRWDYTTSIEETLVALNDLISDGRVHYIGASSMYAWQFAKALWTSDQLGLHRFVSMQNHYNLCYREEEREMIPLCNDQKIGLIPWSPLAGGFLSGKYTRGKKPDGKRYRSLPIWRDSWFKSEDFDVVERVVEVAKEKGVTPSQLALAWIFHKGVDSPIIGASKIKHIEEAVEALTIKLKKDDIERLEEPYKLHEIIGRIGGGTKEQRLLLK